MTGLHRSIAETGPSTGSGYAPDWSDETSAGAKVVRFPAPQHWLVVGDALTRLQSPGDCTSPDAVHEAKRVLALFWEVLGILDNASTELSKLVPIHAAFPDDGSVLLEWIYHDFRIGFSLESDSTKSSWYAVSSETHGDFACSGRLEPSRAKTVFLAAIFALVIPV